MDKIKEQTVPAHKSTSWQLSEKVFCTRFFTYHLPAEIT